MAVTYRYDRMNRLVCEDRDGEGERYAYDPAGNRLEREHYRDGAVDGAETYCYNERNELTCRVNRLTGSAAAYRYDACGNLLLEEEGGKKKEYGYDALNRLARVRTADVRVWENLYDGEGLRAGIRGDGACTTFLYRNGEILAECGEDGEPASRYVYGRGLSHVQTLRDGICHAYHCDEQGSTAYMTGPDGGVENSYRYDAFGNLLERKETVPNRVLYTGQQYDQETGQYYLRARYYNPVVGRFLQEDTYHGDGLNLYAYCANNPVVYYDPSGHDSAAVMKKAEEPDLPVGVGKGGTDVKVKPSNPYKVDAKPSGTVTKITDKMDEATRRSLIRENEAAETIAKNGYNIEQNPVIEGTTRNPDYLIEGEIFDCYSPAENTKVRNVASTIEEKVIKKGQAERVVLNLDDWKGSVDELVKQLNDYPIEGLKEVIIVYDRTVQSIYP